MPMKMHESQPNANIPIAVFRGPHDRRGHTGWEYGPAHQTWTPALTVGGRACLFKFARRSKAFERGAEYGVWRPELPSQRVG